LFGGTGSIGAAICEQFRSEGWQVVIVTRSPKPGEEYLRWDPAAPDTVGHSDKAVSALKVMGPFDAVCWAQGMNCSDSVYTFSRDQHLNIYNANVLYIINSLNVLLNHNLLRRPARLCVISSIWQNIARQSKLSYCVTKAALKGLVLSAAVDLARDGHVINAVLPGVIDTPMTRANLSPEQVQKVEESTLFGRLTTLGEVASCVYNLCKPDTTGMTGQFITVDLGYSDVRFI
jgi:3-oxoacyl-[acyl-carrier protein] reductase